MRRTATGTGAKPSTLFWTSSTSTAPRCAGAPSRCRSWTLLRQGQRRGCPPHPRVGPGACASSTAQLRSCSARCARCRCCSRCAPHARGASGQPSGFACGSRWSSSPSSWRCVRARRLPSTWTRTPSRRRSRPACAGSARTSALPPHVRCRAGAPPSRSFRGRSWAAGVAKPCGPREARLPRLRPSVASAETPAAPRPRSQWPRPSSTAARCCTWCCCSAVAGAPGWHGSPHSSSTLSRCCCSPPLCDTGQTLARQRWSRPS
mmetsp:Transcript_17477/g.52809  ORF Transcript_17477/g.52809 Transcript_17477/m.52809 type:complete len:262 (+) Transcript_17477:408-1193(+)